MEEKILNCSNPEVLRALLAYLIKHQNAKDTLEGILGWWFPKGYVVQKDEVQHAIDFLISKNWLTKHETTNFQKIYGINKKQLKEIKSFHASFKGKADGNDMRDYQEVCDSSLRR
ncbi:MAG: hypothetical protein DYG83_08805 [Candidatus Brocadia sp. AMX2]|uniref:Uncharacterized protein n=1 Tax=Candidatus Brocadia sinica JPN1 TaxID=1197129 RepID=A0ABQ0K1H5_9BACT|nr:MULTISPECIES: hypothetical protein [Brocadia]KXK28582.1 MAG: hypothetical protein UZ01_02614 [Candidatus Brocadia sinica]MBC6933426.1 hypothetical protein [Candidatus Brocadia sp.]MBL1167997.1 hypothetical protein [Candidatus Brocadia sp. AMX1]NOG42576.1 hypothetical protein [Planctomycetota bacterium]KAA0243028.1 MAG: hypothetical protein EDM70_11945 [Candidatus Brocadia sp. AMX2]